MVWMRYHHISKDGPALDKQLSMFSDGDWRAERAKPCTRSAL